MNKFVKTQKELDQLRSIEHGMFYISIAGQVATFKGEYTMTLIAAQDRMADIAANQSAMISDDIANEKHHDAMEAIDVSLQTFILPYRIH